MGRRYKRSIQAAEGIGRSQGRGPAAQAGVGIEGVLPLQFQHQHQHQQSRRQAGLKTLQHRLKYQVLEEEQIVKVLRLWSHYE